jgi:hypothetical protein
MSVSRAYRALAIVAVKATLLRAPRVNESLADA